MPCWRSVPKRRSRGVSDCARLCARRLRQGSPSRDFGQHSAPRTRPISSNGDQLRTTDLRSTLPCETMPAMIVASVEIIPVRLPLREPFVVAYASYPDTLSVLVRIRTREGAEGWGEATPDPNVTGETWGGTMETLRRDLAPVLIGRDARHREAALNALDARVEGAPAAKAALDIALHDLVARAAGMPLWQLLAGRAREALQISRVISMDEPTTMAAAGRRHVADGFRTLKVKVGDPGNPQLDA